MISRLQSVAMVTAILLAVAGVGIGAAANAQDAPRRLMVKNGESIEVGAVYYVAHCRSIMVGLPEVEVLEGPSEVTLSIKEEPVLPRRLGCANKVAGGTLMLTAKGVTEPTESKLAYRLRYKTKDGDRQTSNAYVISLYP
jgi:hypothetical protein